MAWQIGEVHKKNSSSQHTTNTIYESGMPMGSHKKSGTTFCGKPVCVGLVYWGLTPQQQPGSYQGGEMMMMKSVCV